MTDAVGATSGIQHHAANLVTALCRPAARDITGQFLGVRGREVLLFSQPRQVARLEVGTAETTLSYSDPLQAGQSLPSSRAEPKDLFTRTEAQEQVHSASPRSDPIGHWKGLHL
jgi:hypothetical protein